MGRIFEMTYNNFLNVIETDSADLLAQGYIFYGNITSEVSIFGRVVDESSNESTDNSNHEEDESPVRPTQSVCRNCGCIFKNS
ncbi:Hypothetical protein CINCED_3A015322 [Cinara cedri]|uniref:Uncharacterized protein n=1 Tax=Cinara cedri TaxID=506608 RepID=A0A5E4MA51_9HEMI|nr:Hypothetical protein CINCED_3A015322 [Cinara cedri]